MRVGVLDIEYITQFGGIGVRYVHISNSKNGQFY